ncbi:MAG: bifunctional phosphopantothenoylcysteine decarboxylase/phosphopantothenate--cysteine ligase CoaBC [Clostridia bacterium]|nr:bifunctional phosphopantothenoylcysteine decarboxylase/phosphopantothenate--cysteine ligase CoaBC [Clostridia bacterium]
MRFDISGKKILFGVSGGIAAYKALEIISLLKKSGAEVKVIMTKAACEFVSPLSFQTISQNMVARDMFEEPKAWEVRHISLASWADVAVVAPATANICGKLATGIADDMLSTTLMACKAPKIIAPAMNTAMYENPIVQKNIRILKDLGMEFVEPESGILACGDVGKGRLASVEDIYEKICQVLLFSKKDFIGKKVVVTAGGTIEKIDPVRYITNHSSGKMGVAIARAAYYRGADVTLVCGNCSAEIPKNIDTIKVESARDMYDAVMTASEDADIIIKAAAVADYRPETAAENKIKKGKMESISLASNPDILAELGEKYSGKKKLVGFCMETENLEKNAYQKLKKKGLDLIAANSLNEDGAGFKGDTNIITLIDKSGECQKTDLKDKFEIANIILDKVKEI